LVERGGRERDEAVVSALAASSDLHRARILVRLSLSPVGVHGTIPAEMRLCPHLCPDAAIYVLTATSNVA